MLTAGYWVSKQHHRQLVGLLRHEHQLQLEAHIQRGKAREISLCTIMSGRQRVDAVGGGAGQTILRPFLVKWISKD